MKIKILIVFLSILSLMDIAIAKIMKKNKIQYVNQNKYRKLDDYRADTDKIFDELAPIIIKRFKGFLERIFLQPKRHIKQIHNQLNLIT